MRETEITPGSSIFKPEEISFKREKAPTNISAANTLGVFFILLGLSAVVDKIFTRNKGLGTTAALSSVALGLKIITKTNTNNQIPEELSFPPTEARN